MTDPTFADVPVVAPGTDDLNVVIETPKGSRNKFKFDERLRMFRLSGVLPMGAVFPFDFGFVPSTVADDGDPLDILVLMDEPAFAGCLVPTRLLGVVEAEQTEDGRTERNDRLIGVATESRDHQDLRTVVDLNANLVHEIEHFFISYNSAKGKQFRVLGRGDPDAARHLVEQARHRHAARRP